LQRRPRSLFRRPQLACFLAGVPFRDFRGGHPRQKTKDIRPWPDGGGSAALQGA
jgi:hypothetical protein